LKNWIRFIKWKVYIQGGRVGGRGGESRSLCLLKNTFFAIDQFVFCSGKMPYSGLGGMEVVDFLKSGHRLKQPDGCPDKM